MAYKTKSKTGAIWYVPEVEGNDRNDPDAFRLNIAPLTGVEGEQFRIALLDFSGEQDQKAQVSSSIEFRNRILRERIREVRGYVLERADGTVFEPRTGDEFVQAAYEADENDLLERIALDMYNYSDLKSKLWEPSRSQSDSSSAMTKMSGTGVASVVDVPTKPGQVGTTPPDAGTATATAHPTPSYSSPGQEAS